MDATIIYKKHTLAVIFIIAATSICFSQCGSYGGGSSSTWINHHHHHHNHHAPLQYPPPQNWNKFEEVYRWRQLTFSPLDNGKLIITSKITRKSDEHA